jgi:5-methylcytosine-specific restriction protein A
VKYKILAMYYPYKYLTIYSDRHLSYFCDKASIPAVEGDDELVMQRKLIQWKESNEDVKALSYLECVAFLYNHFGHPPKADALVKTKPKLKELKKKLKDFDEKHPKKTLTEIERTERSGLVAAIVKERAAGVCQLCNKPAPFYNKKGEPYLECHHIIWIAKGGPDEVDNAVALCPNCHRKMHSLDEAADVEYLKKVVKK